jgi:hypothetical protein
MWTQMILTSIWYPLETVALTALPNLSGQRHSLTDDALASRPLRCPFFCPGKWLSTQDPTCIQPSRRPLGRLRRSCSCYVLRYRVIGNSSCADPTILAAAFDPGGLPGADPEAPADLVPRSGEYPTDRSLYRTFVLIDAPDAGSTDLEGAGSVSLTTATSGFTKPAIGASLTYSQQWFSQGGGARAAAAQHRACTRRIDPSRRDRL